MIAFVDIFAEAGALWLFFFIVWIIGRKRGVDTGRIVGCMATRATLKRFRGLRPRKRS